jgi:L-threonylcarbamoyladenylate synthase
MLNRAAAKLNQPGAIGIIPTDTVYGVVARASDIAAVNRLYELKSRDDKPGTMIAANINQLVELGIKRRYLVAASQFWPGPVSVIIPHSLDYLHLGLGAQPIRLPKDNRLLKLLEQTGPLLTSSANPPAQAVSTNVQQAKTYFDNKVDFYIDGGDLTGHQASTIIRIVDDAIEIIRQGDVIIEPSGKIG